VTLRSLLSHLKRLDELTAALLIRGISPQTLLIRRAISEQKKKRKFPVVAFFRVSSFSFPLQCSSFCTFIEKIDIKMANN
jgi:hypothetical protein